MHRCRRHAAQAFGKTSGRWRERMAGVITEETHLIPCPFERPGQRQQFQALHPQAMHEDDGFFTHDCYPSQTPIR
jgi:hypothetical protein